MSGILATAVLAGSGINLRGGITVGNDAATRRGYSAPGVATGPGFGAMAPVTFRDNAGVSRTIGALYWRSGSNEIVLAFPAGSPPNTDATFTKLTVGARVVLRSAATYGAWSGPGIAFSWFGQTDPFGANGANTPVLIE